MTAAEFVSYFNSDHFVTELRARTKDGVLAEMAAVLSLDGGASDPNVLLEMIRRRENLGSTALGKGVAIPHGRTTAATQARVVFARSRRGVEYDAEDGEVCRLFFLIVAPYEDRRHEYLPLLSRIVQLVSEEGMRGRLLEVDTFGAFSQLIQEALGE